MRGTDEPRKCFCFLCLGYQSGCKVKKMEILCDVDGTVAEFVQHIINKLNSIFKEGLNGPFPKYEDIKDYNLFKYFNEKQLPAVYTLMAADTFWQTIPTIPGSQEAIKELREQGHTIIFLTKPWKPCRTWVAARMDWLERNFEAKDDEMIFSSRKRQITGDIMIDDNPEFLNNWAKRFKKSKSHLYLFDAPYNRAYRKAKRMIDWKQITQELKDK